MMNRFNQVLTLFVLTSFAPADAQQAKVQPLLQKLEYRIGSWEADIELRGFKVGTLKQTWSWAAGGNLLVSRWTTVLPQLSGFEEDGFAITRVEDDKLVMESFLKLRAQDGVNHDKVTLEVDNSTVKWKMDGSFADVGIESHDTSGITSLVTKRGEAVQSRIVNWRRVDAELEQKPDSESDPAVETSSWEKHNVSRGIAYVQRESGPLTLDAFIPKSDGPHPAILTFQGGAKWSVPGKSDAFPIAIAKHLNIAIFSLNFRLAPKHKFPAQLEDCHEAIRWIHTNAKKYNVDRTRIAAYGYSAPGHLTSLMAVDGIPLDDDTKRYRLCAAVVGAAPSDLTLLDLEDMQVAYLIGGSRKELPNAYRAASPLTRVSSKSCPIFLYHGESDGIIPISQSEMLSTALKEAGVPHEFYVIPDGRHISAFDAVATQKACNFLRNHFFTSQGSNE